MEALMRILGFGQFIDDVKWLASKFRQARVSAESQVDSEPAIESDTNGRLHRKAVSK